MPRDFDKEIKTPQGITNTKAGHDAAVWMANWLRRHPGLAHLAEPKPVIVPAPTPVPAPSDPQVGPPHSLWQGTAGSQAPKGCPATRKTLDDIFIKVDTEFRELIRATYRVMHPGITDDELEHALGGIFRVNAGFSNQHPYDSDDFRVETLNTCGQLFEAVTGLLHKAVGVLWLEVYCLDPNNLPAPPKTLADINIFRWFFPTIETQLGPGPTHDLKIGLNPWPQLGGRSLIPSVNKGGTMWVQWNNPNRDDRVGLVRVDGPRQPFIPAHPDVTFGLIPA